MSTITFYTRDGCHLCHEALAVLQRVRQRHPFELRVVDLDTQAPADKRAAYDQEVPVVEIDGRKVMKYRADEDRLVRLLTA
jgi:glutaredoxin